MKRSIILGITLLVLLSAVGLLTVGAQSRDLSTVITYPAYIRAGPGTEYESYGVLRMGAAFRIDGRNFSGNWVRGITAHGTVGWVDSGAVEITYAELVGLVIVTIDTPCLLTPPTGDAASAYTAPVVVESATATLPTPDSGLLPNVAPGYEGGFPAGPMINLHQGDHAVQIFPMTNGNGVPFLMIYRIVDSEGRYIMSVSAAELGAYLVNPPAIMTPLKREDGPGYYGPAVLYIRPDGNFQFEIGRDGENRTQVVVFEGPEALDILCYYVYVPVGIVGQPHVC